MSDEKLSGRTKFIGLDGWVNAIVSRLAVDSLLFDCLNRFRTSHKTLKNAQIVPNGRDEA